MTRIAHIPFADAIDARRRQQRAMTVIQALDACARFGAGYATITHSHVSIRYPYEDQLDHIIRTAVFFSGKRAAAGQVIASGIPVFDIRPIEDLNLMQQWLELPLIVVPPHKVDAPPYGSGDYASVEYVAERARMLAVLVHNVAAQADDSLRRDVK